MACLGSPAARITSPVVGRCAHRLRRAPVKATEQQKIPEKGRTVTSKLGAPRVTGQ